MNFDNIIEKRSVDKGVHRMVLEISLDEYSKDYNEINRDHALSIVERYLENRGDDGRPSNIEIDRNNKEDIIRISADINYLNNEHTDYRFR